MPKQRLLISNFSISSRFFYVLFPSLEASFPPSEIVETIETCLAGDWQVYLLPFLFPSLSPSLATLALSSDFLSPLARACALVLLPSPGSSALA